MRQLLVSTRYRVLRLRHDWWYRWAHDPLCDRLGGGVLAIGKLRLCRSCVAMYAGMAAGGALVAAQPALASPALAPHAWFGSAAAAGAASIPSQYAQLDRGAKDGLRFTTGALGGLIFSFARARRWKWFAAIAVFAGVAYRVLTLARSKQKATACDGCPELEVEGICSGFTQQAVSLRAYEQAASDIAMRERARA